MITLSSSSSFLLIHLQLKVNISLSWGEGGRDGDGDGEGLWMLWVDGGGGSSTLGGMFPARVGHNAPSVQAGPQELVLQQGRGGHQWPDDVNHPEPIHSDKQPPPSRPPPPPPPPLFCFLPSPPSFPPHILFCWTKTRAAESVQQHRRSMDWKLEGTCPHTH